MASHPALGVHAAGRASLLARVHALALGAHLVLVALLGRGASSLAVRHRVTVESFRALAPEASHVISAQCVPSAGGTGTFVKVGASLGRACVTIESGGAVAAITALHIRTYGTWSANSWLGALVHVGAPVVRIADEAVPAQTRVVAGHVDALGVHAARLGIQTLVDVCTPFLAVPFEA